MGALHQLKEAMRYAAEQSQASPRRTRYSIPCWFRPHEPSGRMVACRARLPPHGAA